MEPVNVDELDTFELKSRTTDDAEWVGQFFAYGGSGADQSTVIHFAMPPGKRLGRHTDTAEETQFVLSGAGELLLDEGARPVRAGDVFVLPEGAGPRPAQHGLREPSDHRVLLFPAGRAALERRGLGAGRPQGHRHPEPLSPTPRGRRSPSASQGRTT
jgi:quercetin dioxygenase-like cupin family protein